MMDERDAMPFQEMINALGEVYGKTFSKFAMKLYWDTLKGYPLESLLRAGAGLAKSSKWMPKPADFVEAIDGGVGDRATIAWNKVKQAIGSAGAYKSVCFDDPTIHHAVRSMGSWPELCRTTEKELPFVGKRFEATYRAMVQNPPKDHPAKLIGISEGECSGRFEKHISPPVLIGNKEEAAEVLRLGSASAGGVQISQVIKMIGE